jgi:hypothetical protein
VRSNARGTPILYKLGTTQAQDLRQGELVRWSASDNGIVRHVRDQSGFAGLTAESQVSNTWTLVNQQRFVPDPVLVKVFTSGLQELVGTDAETYEHGVEVYMGADSQTITNLAGVGGVKVGKVWLTNLAPKSGAVRVPVLIDEYTKTEARGAVYVFFFRNTARSISRARSLAIVGGGMCGGTVVSPSSTLT